MCGSDPRISEWSIADAHVLVRSYTFPVRSDRLESEALTGRLISVSCLAHCVVSQASRTNVSDHRGRLLRRLRPVDVRDAARNSRARNRFATEAVQTPARVNVMCVTPLGDEMASIL